MIEFYKKRSETPLQALSRLRLERPDLSEETLSYAGRLDPMAEGVLSVLVGEEENRARKDFLEKDKEYQVEFLIGCSTDTGDILGIILEKNFERVEEEKIKESIKSLSLVTTQTYPWYSSKTVEGVPLFEYARAGKFDIERPVREVKIYSVSNVEIREVSGGDLIVKNIRDIENVKGDFRQEQIINSWRDILKQAPDKFQVVSCTLNVSSGTYIRSLTEEIQGILNRPVLVERLVRTKIF